MKKNVVFVEDNFDVTTWKNTIRYLYFVVILLGCSAFTTFF